MSVLRQSPDQDLRRLHHPSSVSLSHKSQAGSLNGWEVIPGSEGYTCGVGGVEPHSQGLGDLGHVLAKTDGMYTLAWSFARSVADALRSDC